MLNGAAILLGFSLAGTAPSAPALEGKAADDASLSPALFPRESLLGEEPEPRAAHLIPPLPRELSKKELWLVQKLARPNVHVPDRDIQRAVALARRAPAARNPAATVNPDLPLAGTRMTPLTTLYNLKTRESLPMLPGRTLGERFHGFLRDHFTNQATKMDTRLIDVLTAVATKFRAARIEVVSGYRSPKYNLMLRKKGHEVARSSEHTEGNAVDFRIRGVKTTVLLKFVKSLRRGGVGYYPNSQFVHSDTGRIRYWKGS